LWWRQFMVTQEQIASRLGVARQLVTFALLGYPQVDKGVGALYSSQQAVAKLLPAAGIELPEAMTLPDRRKQVQTLMAQGDVRAAAIYGDNPAVPKVETMVPEPKSPYAITNFALESPATGIFNVAYGRRLSLHALADTICRLAGSHAEIRHAAERAGDVKHSVASIDQLLSAGFKPPPNGFEAGLSVTVEFFRATRSPVRP